MNGDTHMTSIARTVAGFALAVGIAGAAAVAMADQASAAPGRSGSSVDGSAHDSRGSRADPVHRKPRPRAAAVREVSAPAALAAVTRVERRPVRTAPAAPVVAAPTTRPTTALLPTAAPVTRGRLITIYKGTHFVIPNRWALWVTKDSGGATFTADSAYDLKDADQLDWNKLAGITFTPWRPDRNSSMVVWRYNLQNGTYEVGPFFNVDFRYVFPTTDEIITVPVDQTFTYSVDYDGISVTYGGRTVSKSTPADLKPNFWTSARVTGWFGGSEVAPRTISYYQIRS
ncbi:hypothetical protein MCEMIE22_01941 [Mycobacteriaceae bacterium]